MFCTFFAFDKYVMDIYSSYSIYVLDEEISEMGDSIGQSEINSSLY